METGIGISTPLNVWKNGQQKNVQHQKPVLQQVRLLTGLNVGGETRSIAIQLRFAAMLQDKLHVFCCPFCRTFRRGLELAYH